MGLGRVVKAIFINLTVKTINTRLKFEAVNNNDNSGQKGKFLEKVGYSRCKHKTYNEKHIVDGTVMHNPIPKRTRETAYLVTQ